MGENKKLVETNTESGGCFKSVIIWLTGFSVICAFGLVNYLQFNEILNLKQEVDTLGTLKGRIELLESKILSTKEATILSRQQRQVPVDSMSAFVTSLVQQEVKVLESYCGNASKICLPGAKGDIGYKGNQGVQGTAGNSGPPGPKGQQGNYGVPGIPGLKGDHGLKGEIGMRGEKGHYGASGVPGPKGDKGNYGVPGVPGFKGEMGSTGLRGGKGEKGDEGRPLPFNQQCCSTLSKPKYTGNQTETVYGYVGQSVLLPCQSAGYPPPTTHFTPSLDPKGKNRYAMMNGGMQIQSIEITDGGQYRCNIENILGKTEKIINLVVTDPVVATTTPTTIDAKEGDSFTITCDVSGTPTPTVTWNHIRPDGQTVPLKTSQTGVGLNIYVVTSAHQSDAGSYTCTASNQYETSPATTTVRITGRPEITSPPVDKFILQGSTITIPCGVVSNPPSTVTWTYPLTGSNTPLNGHVNGDNSITLVAVDSSNTGLYTCKATNAQGTSIASATITVGTGVTVTAKPHVMPVTGNEVVLNMQCSSTGNPAPTISWSKEGIPSLAAAGGKYLALSGGNLIITGVDINQDTGIYKCNGNNNHGSATDSTIVYKAEGQLTCTTKYSEVSCGIGMTCGGKCPKSCTNTGSRLYGFQAYPMESPICLSAIHTGTLPNTDDLVVWQHQSKSTSYPAQTNNGLTSLPHPTTSESNLILSPASTGSSQGAIPLFG